MHPIDLRQACRHESFRLPPGGDRTICADCGASATDAVAHQRTYVNTLEREISIAVSDISAMAAELEREGHPAAVRLRRIARALDKAQPLS